MRLARAGQGGEKPWDGRREQPKENPGAVVARRAGKMPMAVQHGGELGGMLGRLPSRPGIPPWCKGCGISCWRAATRCSALGISVLCFLSCYFRQAKKWVVFRETAWLHQAGMCGDGAIRQLGEPAAGRGHSHGTGKALHSFSIK